VEPGLQPGGLGVTRSKHIRISRGLVNRYGLPS
jgi:hypothetical protein